MATKKTYGTARAFTEGHLEVIGDQSEVTNPSPAPLSAKQLASYAMQRKQNAKPFAERNTGANFDRHAQDQSFKARLSRWEEKEANRGNQVHGFGPKPVDLGKDRGGNEYKPYNYQMQGNSALRGLQGTRPENRINQARWADGRDGSPVSRTTELAFNRKQSGELTRRQKEDQYASQQPLARNETQTGIQGNFGSLGNFFNEDD